MALISYARGQNEPLSEHFSGAEFACRGTSCGCDEVCVDEALIGILETVRTHFHSPVNISSGYRCPRHNAACGGAQGSYHCKGMAADITIAGIAPSEIAKYAESIGVLGIGLYDGFVHIDTRTRKSFWYSSREESRETFGGSGEGSAALPVLRRGQKSQSVRALQLLLIGYGGTLDPYGADGNFGAATQAAVIAFQTQNGLTPDGIVGEKTWAVLLGIETERRT